MCSPPGFVRSSRHVDGPACVWERLTMTRDGQVSDLADKQHPYELLVFFGPPPAEVEGGKQQGRILRLRPDGEHGRGKRAMDRLSHVVGRSTPVPREDSYRRRDVLARDADQARETGLDHGRRNRARLVFGEHAAAVPHSRINTRRNRPRWFEAVFIGHVTGAGVQPCPPASRRVSGLPERVSIMAAVLSLHTPAAELRSVAPLTRGFQSEY